MDREFRLGQTLYFVLWDDDSEEAGVARGEVVQYASDHSKVRVRVVEAPQQTVIGRTTWVLPDRLDDGPRAARRSYQRRAREELRQQAAAPSEQVPTGGEAEAVGEAEASWQQVFAGWADVDLLVDTIDFEAGWPQHQARIAKFAVLSVLRLRPALARLLASLPGEGADAVRTALDGGALGAADTLVGDEPSRVLELWDRISEADVVGAADQIAGLRAALTELAAAHGLNPALEPLGTD